MNLYITNDEVKLIQGLKIEPAHMLAHATHAFIASTHWNTLFIDLVEEIPEGTLRFLPSQCAEIMVCVPDKPSLHQLHLLVELFPTLDGTLRKAYMKGENINGILPKVWEHRCSA